MNESEAKQLLGAELARYGLIPYRALAPVVGTNECVTRLSDSGHEFQIEIDIRWDAKPDGAIRILAAIDDGQGSRAFVPLCESILVKS